jgi:hypothetical protein
MSKKVLVNLDMNQNEIQNAVAHNLASAPANPVKGQEYFNTADGQKYIYNGSSWVNETAQGTTYNAGTGIDSTALGNGTIQVATTIASKTDIGNGTLTIQRNGSAIGSFKANATSASTINISVPTTATEVGALPSSTKYGAAFIASLNTTDYKLTMTLKDQNGNALGTAQVVDFPIESVVVGGSYDSANKKIVLTLQNGNTIDVPVGDLVAGLQSEITSSNMLDADLVDDSTSAHKFVSTSEKATWNAKQDALTAGSNISINGNTISATNTTYSNGSGLSLTGTTFSVDFTTVATAAQGAKADTAVQVYSTSNPALTASGGVCTWTVTHNLGSRKVEVKVYEISTWEEVITSVALASTNAVTVKLNSTSNITAGTYQVVVAGH